MQRLAWSALAALTLVGCQKADDPLPAPTPTLLGQRWMLQSEQREATPLDGSPATVYTVAPPAGPVFLTYVDEQHFTLDMQLPSAPGPYHIESTYSYQGQDLTFASSYSWTTGTVAPRTVRVAELSAHRLVLLEVWESPDTHYFSTQTFSR
ncbi:hypothetical protein HHL22_20320 [Hymenobacter sp. RP-2-7]|uniref:Lipocalin-like domain-containing protein n=1 Tax=Hymenobacter polaris TaxID=2682546 RepID=A0A7Y0AHN8_9BACT|nr:hypothetical protein [Hymenobacter polaris]NML67553.1 hypothetical protein [Hymenobacter polaris]